MQDQSVSTSARRAWPETVGYALVLVLVPLMLLSLALPPEKFASAVRKQDVVFWLACGLGCVSLLLWNFATPLFPRRRSILPLILLGTSLLLIANIAWNRRFTQYVATHHYRHEVFRKKARGNTYWPVYGKFDNAFMRRVGKNRHSLVTLPWVLVSCVIAGVWFAWIRRRPLENRWGVPSFAALILLQIGLICAFAACEPWPTRFSLQISGYLEFSKDLHRFQGIADTLRHYVERMPTLQWYGQHYPPGNLILIQVEKAIGLPGFSKAVVVLMTALSSIPLYLLGKELELDGSARSAALLMFAATTGVLIYCTINTTSLLLLPGTICLWLLVRSMKAGSIVSAVGLGCSFAFYLMFSFSASILGVLMALTAALAWWGGKATTRNVLRTGVISLATVGACIGALFLTTKFNLLACFITAVRGHESQQGNGGFDDPTRYLLRSTGNVIAYLMSIVPLCILGACAMWHARRRRHETEASMSGVVFVALGLTVLIAGFSGLFYLETERIWIFLTPVFALAAGYELSRRASGEGRDLVDFIFLLVLVISCSQEFFFQHYR